MPQMSYDDVDMATGVCDAFILRALAVRPEPLLENRDRYIASSSLHP